jgi:uncharacterized protein (DUF4415 family)
MAIPSPLRNRPQRRLGQCHDWRGGLVVLPHKRRIYALYDAYGVEYFKQGGRGYQARMNAVLKAYVDAQLEKRPQSRP